MEVPAELHSNLVALTPSCSTVNAFKLVYNRRFLCKSCMLTIGIAKEKICRAGVGGKLSRGDVLMLASTG